jgi:PHD/YefM family antitoxin component YafN of YafNO toxin-antitoxin module
MTDVVMLPACELDSPDETAFLLRSSNNVQRLLEALRSSFENQGGIHNINELKKKQVLTKNKCRIV